MLWRHHCHSQFELGFAQRRSGRDFRCIRLWQIHLTSLCEWFGKHTRRQYYNARRGRIWRGHCVGKKHAKKSVWCFKAMNCLPIWMWWTIFCLGQSKPKRDKDEATQQAHQLLKRVGLYDRRTAFPRELSGGQNSVSPLLGRCVWIQRRFCWTKSPQP